MAEAMADKTRVPDQKFTRAYGEWGKGRWGGLLTGKRDSKLPIIGKLKADRLNRKHPG